MRGPEYSTIGVFLRIAAVANSPRPVLERPMRTGDFNGMQGASSMHPGVGKIRLSRQFGRNRAIRVRERRPAPGRWRNAMRILGQILAIALAIAALIGFGALATGSMHSLERKQQRALNADIDWIVAH